MLEALLTAGVTPHILVGTSIGSVNAAFLAADPSIERARELSALWRRLSAEEFFPLNPALVARALLQGAVFSPEPLRRLIEREIPYRRVEEAAVPLRIVATRCERRAGQPAVSLHSVAAGLDRRAGQAAVPLRLVAARLERTVEQAGIPLRIVTARFERRTQVLFAEGSVVDALMASCALPLVFPPYRIADQVYVDGGLSEYVPLLPALREGARVVYVLSLGAAHEHRGRPPSPRARVYRSLGNRFWRRTGLDLERQRADHREVRVVELPAPLTRVGLRDFSRLGELIDHAREQAERFLDSDLCRTA